MANGGIIGTVNNPTSTTATGVWQQEEQYEAVRDGTWPSRPLFTTKSARFNDGSSDSLNRTPSGDGNKRTFTFSTWLKISTIKEHMFFTCGVYSSTSLMQFYLNANGTLTMSQENSSGSIQSTLTTTQVFRDVSAWYHLVIAIDTTQGTDSNRVKLYVNGSQVTSFSTSTYPSQNLDFACNTSSVINTIGNRSGGSFYFDGYMAEIILVDGSQLAPTSFGVANSDGVWTPIIYSGTFGTNGFNLQFEDASSLGTDSSANGNTFTVNNLTSIDQSTDYPEVNFATLNPLNVDPALSYTFAQGNLDVTIANSGGEGMTSSTFAVSNGKWYWECKLVSSSTQGRFGVVPTSIGALKNPSEFGIAWQMNDATMNLVNTPVSGSWGSNPNNNDILMFALDCDNQAFYFGVNGTWRNSGNPTSGASRTGGVNYSGEATLTSDDLTVGFGGNFFSGGGSQQGQYNFGGTQSFTISSGNTDGNGYGNFEYAVPSGYYSLNTKNLGEFG